MRTIENSLSDALFEQVERKAFGQGRNVGEFAVGLIEDSMRPAARGVALLGMFGDEPELVEAICAEAMRGREHDPLRAL